MTIVDQIGHKINLNASAPKNIISLVPSQTELLYDLGLENQVIGITKFCVHPPHWLKLKEKIGGTKNLNIDKIINFKPDLIIANKEENTKDQILQLQNYFPVYTSDIKVIEDALTMIQNIGLLTKTNPTAKNLIQTIQNQLKTLSSTNPIKPKIAYFIWKNPYMVAANHTFIHHMIQLAGFENAFAHLDRYPIISNQQLQSSPAEAFFLSSEPYPFKPKDIHEFQSFIPSKQIQIVNGEMFSWYGSRLTKAIPYLQNLHTQFIQY